MPYTRLLAVLSAYTLIVLAVIGPRGNPILDERGLLYAAAFGVVLLAMAMLRDFLLDILVVFFTAYVVQRIIVLYFLPGEIDYRETLYYTPSDTAVALRFLFFAAFAILAANLLLRMFGRSLPASRPHIAKYTPASSVTTDELH